MTDMTPFERDLARALDGYLGPRQAVDARAISRAAIASKTRATGLRWRLPVAPMQRLAWLAVVALTLVALLALAAGVGREQPRPTTANGTPALPTNAAVVVPPAPTGTPGPAPQPLSPVRMSPSYLQATSDGGVDLVSGAPDGSERFIRHFAVNNPAQYTSADFGHVSGTGWLALYVEQPDRYEFFDLNDPSAASWPLSFWGGTGGVWSNDGRFAVIRSGSDQSPDGTDIVDPATRTITHLTPEAAVGGGPTMYWAADGSGLLGYTRGSVGIIPVGDGQYAAGIPAMADRRGRREFGPDGTFLCPGFTDYCESSDLITTKQLSGATTEWRSLASVMGTVADASFPANGQGLWALTVDDSSDQPVSLLRLNAPGDASPQVVAVVDRSALPQPTVDKTQVGFAGLAPDDSIIVVSQNWELGGESQHGSLEIAGDGSAAHVHAGALAGFVPAATLASWPASAPAPTPTARPSGPPVMPVAGPYVPVFTRTVANGTAVHVFVATPDGTERVVVIARLVSGPPGCSRVHGWLAGGAHERRTRHGDGVVLRPIKPRRHAMVGRYRRPVRDSQVGTERTSGGECWQPLPGSAHANELPTPMTRSRSAVALHSLECRRLGVYSKTKTAVGIQPVDGSSIVAGSEAGLGPHRPTCHWKWRPGPVSHGTPVRSSGPELCRHDLGCGHELGRYFLGGGSPARNHAICPHAQRERFRIRNQLCGGRQRIVSPREGRDRAVRHATGTAYGSGPGHGPRRHRTEQASVHALIRPARGLPRFGARRLRCHI